MASSLRKIVSFVEKETSGNSWFCNITKSPWNSKQNFITLLCQGSKLSPRSIWPNYLLPGIHTKIGARAQNSQILSQCTCAKIPAEIFNWVQTPINADALIRMLIKLSFLVLEQCDSNPTAVVGPTLPCHTAMTFPSRSGGFSQAWMSREERR